MVKVEFVNLVPGISSYPERLPEENFYLDLYIYIDFVVCFRKVITILKQDLWSTMTTFTYLFPLTS